MKVTYRDKEWTIVGKRRVRDVIVEVGFSPQTVLAIRDGKLLTEDIVLNEDDDLQLVAVISGG